VDVASKNNLGMFSCPGDNRFDFMWGEVLGFVYNKENFGQGSSADECQGGYGNFLGSDKLINFCLSFFVVGILFLNKADIIPNGGKKWIGLRLGVARQKSDFPVT